MKTATITFRLDESTKKRLEQMAAAQDVPVSQLVRAIIKEAIMEGEQWKKH